MTTEPNLDSLGTIRAVAQITNPLTGELVTLPKPVIVLSGDLDSFVAGYQQRLAEEWGAAYPDATDHGDPAEPPSTYPPLPAPGHAVLGIEFRQTSYVYPYDVQLVARCACGEADYWNHVLPGDQLITWLRRHGADILLSPTPAMIREAADG